MPAQSDSAAAELLDLAQVLYQANHCILGATCFLVYDYVITFSREVNLFWTHKYTGASVLFFVNRYVTLVWNIMGLAQLGQISQQVCPVYYKVFSAISYSQYIIWAAFSGLRAYALSRSRILAMFLSVLATVPAGINYAQFRFGLTGATDPDFGCFSTTNMTRDFATNGYLIAHMSDRDRYYPPGFDLGDTGEKGHHVQIQPYVSLVVIHHNASRRVILSLNVLHLAFTLSATFGRLISNIAIFEDQITAVLVSRFLLDLQTANQRSLKLSSSDPLHLSAGSFDGAGGTLAFARVVGSLGEGFVGPLSLGSDPEDDDFSDTYYWSGSTGGEDEEVELADKVGKSSDAEAALPAATVESLLETDNHIEEVPVVVAKDVAG